jgi:outer membrane protein OmpA-like peptidoglycan-associated protein/dipeptidyl aminopeptidase/acylaminoacyl peptidase
MIKKIWIALLMNLLCISLFAQKKPVVKVNADTVKITITNLGKAINTPYPEYAPVISADGEMLVYTSRRPVTEKEIKKAKMSMENVYQSNYDIKKKKWTDAVRLSSPVNQEGRHNSAIALSNDGQQMLLYRDDESGNGDIYESHLIGNSWTTPVKLDEPVNSKNHESSASISPDGRTIYFVSNRKGGQGGRDIWMCTFNNNKWDKAENLGSIVNTTEDEEGVFIHPDGKTLYFSSKGHNSTGGYDIFRTTNENGKWTEPKSMGANINTIDDDLYFVLAANGQIGFYSSAKQGGLGDKDIYEIHFTPLKVKKEKVAEGPQLTLLKGVITDEESKAPLEAEIEIIDNVKNQTITTIKSNSSSGKYLASLPSGKNYGIIVKVKGYLFHSENVDIPFSAGYQEIIKDIQLKKLEVGKSIVLNNIFYDFDKATLRSESMSELERLVLLLNENPTLAIELSSHTDDKGTDEYNQRLSQLRAQSVVDFLISKGIANSRLVAKGYGEIMPVATNDTEEGRQQNRRTEFKILSK